MLISILYIIIGLAGLIFGGDWLVDGAVGIARRAKMSPMVIGLTIVAFGTSAPELLVSLQAALGGTPGIALGNVIGSNIANIALILGVTALIHPVPVHTTTTRIDAPFLFLGSLALTVICYFTDTITRVEGIVGLLLLFCFVAYQIRTSKTDGNTDDTDADSPTIPLWRALLLLVLGIAALKYGAQFLVDGAVDIAHSLGVADRIIGLTIVAIGTSLPELFASVIAARKGSVDLAIGNVIGSNLFNIMCVLAASCAVQPIELSLVGPIATDCFWMLGLTALIWFQLRTDYRLSRTEGAVLLVIYASFLTTTIIG